MYMNMNNMMRWQIVRGSVTGGKIVGDYVGGDISGKHLMRSDSLTHQMEGSR